MSYLGSMGETMRCYALFRSERLEELGLSGYQYLYLRSVSQFPGITQEALAQRLTFNKSSVARQVTALEKKGFLKRVRDPKDKRNLLVYLTEKGEALLPEIDRCQREFFRCIQEDLSEEERILLETLCEKVRRRAKEEIQKL